MASIQISGGKLDISLSPLDALLAVHGSFHIPLEHVRGVRVADENGWRMMWRKLVGTNAPSLKMAGTFFAADGLIFCDYRDGRACVELDLAGETYKRLIIQLDDAGPTPQSVAAQIQEALAR
ncbi:MAG: hypothetical protein NVS1B14_03340 [Vulcanimicrobiaceae bacterium]